MTRECPGAERYPYPTFDDDPARSGLRLPEPMTEAEAQAAESAEVWGPAGPPVSYAAWLAESLEPEAGDLMNPDLPVPFWPACPPAPDVARAAPIPYRLTPLAEAALAEPGPEPEAGL